MQLGISTSSLFLKADNDRAMALFKEWRIPVAEVFLTTFSEYNRAFGKLLHEINGETEVHSVHVLNTQYEPQLYNRHPKVRKDAYTLLTMAMEAAEELHAKYYTFHGVARIKRTPYILDYDKIGADTALIFNICKQHGVTLSYENVHWAYYNEPGFFTEVKRRVPGLSATLDIKQARQSKIDYREFLAEMGNSVVTLHLSDVDENGKICLPGKGIFDFYELFSRVRDMGADPTALIEVYPETYDKYEDLLASLDYLKEVAAKVK